jgi:hypothetical protein
VACLRVAAKHWPYGRERLWASRVGPRLVASIEAPSGGDWQTEAVTFTSTRLTVVTITSPGSAGRFVVKVPCTAEGAERMRRQVQVLAALHADPRLESLCRVLPRCVGNGTVDGRRYWVEQGLPGIPASSIVRGHSRREALLGTAAGLIGSLHGRTREQTVIDKGLVEQWVNAPLRQLEAIPAGHCRRRRLLDTVQRLRAELAGALAGRTVGTSWIHGDFWPGNLLATQPGPQITGVVDWDCAAPRQLPLHDLLHLYVYSRRLARGDELGDIIVRALHQGVGEAIGVPAGQAEVWLDGIPQRPAVLLYWLRHVMLFIDSEGHHDNPRWLRANVERVLANV